MKLHLFLLVALLAGCQQTPDQLLAKTNSEQSVKSKIICKQSTTPPLKNTKKLKEMLLAKGKIDASLSAEDINNAVKEYIRKKNAAYKNCKK